MADEIVPTFEEQVAAAKFNLQKLIDHTGTNPTSKPVLLAWLNGLGASAQEGGDVLLKRVQKHLTANPLPESADATSEQAETTRAMPLTQAEIDRKSKSLQQGGLA
jgi:hypothetical protein